MEELDRGSPLVNVAADGDRTAPNDSTWRMRRSHIGLALSWASIAVGFALLAIFEWENLRQLPLIARLAAVLACVAGGAWVGGFLPARRRGERPR